MPADDLQAWLDYYERLHPSEIELGLERVGEVARRMALPRPAPVVVTVGGTNGKGSCIALLEAIWAQTGYRVGSYTSPHLLRYNERVRIAGDEASDAALIASFERIERARGEIELTYFEVGTLAALALFADSELDVALLEVGLGGRLDAVNIVDADCAVITAIGLDHQGYLGETREAIAREKAGILRAGRPAVCGEVDPPQSLLQAVDATGARMYRLDRDFGAVLEGDGWRWCDTGSVIEDLPLPGLAGRWQLANAACALQVVQLFNAQLPVNAETVRRALPGARLSGRMQRIPGEIETLLDVAHNPQAAGALADYLQHEPIAGRTLAVLGMLADKDAAAVIEALMPSVNSWYLAGLSGSRAREATELAAVARDRGVAPGALSAHATVDAALAAAAEAVEPGDRIVVLGSFLTVASALARDV